MGHNIKNDGICETNCTNSNEYINMFNAIILIEFLDMKCIHSHFKNNFNKYKTYFSWHTNWFKMFKWDYVEKGYTTLSVNKYLHFAFHSIYVEKIHLRYELKYVVFSTNNPFCMF